MAITRRQFVKGAGVALGGAILGTGSLVAGCSSPGPTSPNGGAQATVPGFNGDVTVSLTADPESGAVSDVVVEGAFETPDRGGRAVAALQDAMNASGSVDVDTVSGATVTSVAILDAAACAKAAALGASAAEADMAPGTYTAVAHGHYPGIPLTLDVTISERSIDAVEVTGENLETELMLRAAVDTYIPRVLEHQALSVDAVTGATMTSSAIRLALERCVKDAFAAAGAGPEAVAPWLRRAEHKPAPARTIEKDVVVIGLGGAGMAAALSCAEQGLSVIALEKAGKYGGTLCVTSESLAVNPPRFKAEKNGGADFVDAAALRADWLERTRGDAKEELVDLFLSESGATIDWLHFDHDWPYELPGPGHSSYAVYNCCYTYSPYTLTGTKSELARRIDGIMEQYVELGGEYLLETEVTKLVRDDASGAVVGVEAASFDGSALEVKARAVVLATGGFGENEELMDRFMVNDHYPLAGTWHLYGMATNDGAVIKQALDLGAGTFNPSVPPLSHLAGFPVNLTGFGTREKDEVSFFTGHTAIWSEGDLPTALSVAADALAVDREGRRFMNEEEFATHGAIKAGPEYYTVWSQDQLDAFRERGLRYADPGPSMGYVGCQSTIPLDTPLERLDEVMEAALATGYAHRADTVEELAELAGMRPDALRSSVDAYNEGCAAGRDDDFGKSPDHLTPIGEGPYWALLGCAFYYTTAGALDVDANLNVLRADGAAPIEGLYAVGTDSMGVLMTERDQYLDYGGAASGWALTSGRLAGRRIAERLA